MKLKIKLLISCLFTMACTVCFSQEKLDIEGAIILKDSEDASPVSGTIRFNSANNDFEGWTGTEWVSLTKGISGLTGRVSDIEGNEYRTVTIGNKQWMADNLKVTRFNDGTSIPKVDDPTDWSNLTVPAFNYYNSDSTTYFNTYGILYNFYVVADSNSKNVCPVGWHPPSDMDFTVLTDYLGGLTVAGAKTKEPGTALWNPPNTGATNESGFSARPNGRRSETGAYSNIKEFGYWWTSSEANSTSAWYRSDFRNAANMGRGSFDKNFGCAVRCIK